MSFFEAVKKKQKTKEKEPIWLLAYADLTTNLMCLFLLMLSMSTISSQKFSAVAKEVSRTRTDSLDDLQLKINAAIKARKLEKVVTTELGMFGLNVEFMNGVLFESASAKLSPFAANEATPILQILGKTEKKYLMSFEGHTDDVPLKKSTTFKDNWALSSARGVAVLTKMREMGVPDERMSIAGFANTHPKVPYKGKVGKELESARAANRRVVIRVYQ